MGLTPDRTRMASIEDSLELTHPQVDFFGLPFALGFTSSVLSSFLT